MSEALFATLDEYASLGVHRTGTEVDRSTAEWIAKRLAALGLECELIDVPFDRYVVDSELCVDGSAVAHLPTYYEWVGDIDTTNVAVCSFDPQRGGFPGLTTGPIAEAKAAGADAVVLATDHPEGSLVAVNRDTEAPRSGFPSVLVAGRELARLETGSVSLRMSARVEPGLTTNVVATNGVEGRPLMLTTPLNGWFGCAGERGSGVALLLEFVERFCDTPLLIVATGGHELSYFGAHRWVDSGPELPMAIVHLGASLAVEDRSVDGDQSLTAFRMAMTSLGAPEAEPLTVALQPIGLDLATDTTTWIGEGEAFSRLGVPLLSFTGAGLDFHTPEDTPERATSPDSLSLVADAIERATQQLDNLVRTT